MARTTAWRSPAAVIPKYSRTAALGLETASSTSAPPGPTTNSSATGWSYIECHEVTTNGPPPGTGMRTVDPRASLRNSRTVTGRSAATAPAAARAAAAATASGRDRRAMRLPGLEPLLREVPHGPGVERHRRPDGVLGPELQVLR